jgi:selenocysteine-specific elongation factor
MIVVLNKIDSVPLDKREEKIKKVTAGLQKTLQNTKFAQAPIVPISASPNADDSQTAQGVDALLAMLLKGLTVPQRSDVGPFIFAIDHCFPIKGNTAVITIIVT